MDIQFAEKKLIERIYTVVVALLTTRRLKVIYKKNFAKVILDKNVKHFVVYVSSSSLKSITIHQS